MKKQTVSLLLFLLAVSGLFYACSNTVNNHAGALEFDSIQVNRTEHLFGDTAKPACNLVINLAYASRSVDVRLKDSLNSYFLAFALGDQYIGTPPAEAVEQYADDYTRTYRSDLESMYQEETQEQTDDSGIPAWYNYYKSLTGHVQLYHKHLLVYCLDYQEYTGGAHGIYATTYLNLDLHTLAPLRLNDLFTGDYEEALTDLLWNQLMADNHVATREELEEMGYGIIGNLEPTENFCLGAEGITFLYNVYEIAPYVMGQTAITLPYAVMQHLLDNDCMILKEAKAMKE